MHCFDLRCCSKYLRMFHFIVTLVYFQISFKLTHYSLYFNSHFSHSLTNLAMEWEEPDFLYFPLFKRVDKFSSDNSRIEAFSPIDPSWNSTLHFPGSILLPTILAGHGGKPYILAKTLLPLDSPEQFLPYSPFLLTFKRQFQCQQLHF